MTDASEAMGVASAEALARFCDTLPEGVEFVLFVIADDGEKYQSVLTSTLSTDEFVPVLRGWLKRYDAGEATPDP